METKRIIIIGSSAAGLSAAREVRSIDKEAEALIFTEENYYPYYRPYLTEYIGDEGVAEKSNFYLNKQDWFAENNIKLMLGRRVTAVDPAAHTVSTVEGVTGYTKLIIASGSSPFVPIPEALEKKNVFTVRTFDQAKRVNDYAKNISSAIVIGGGLLGLEAAYSLLKKRIKVSVIELAERILPMQLDREGSSLLEGILAEQGVDLVLGDSVEEVQGGETASGVRLKSGRQISANMIIFSIGVRSNIALARDCGIAVNRAICVNEKMETSAPDIYACGDAAEFNGRTFALWMPATKQGKVAGSNAAGRELLYADEEYPAVLNAFGTRLYSLGDRCADGSEPDVRLHQVLDRDKGEYKKLFFRNDRLVGVILIGDISESQGLSAAIKKGSTYSELVKD